MFIHMQAISEGIKIPNGAIGTDDDGLKGALSQETEKNLVAEYWSSKVDAASESEPRVRSPSSRSSSEGRRQKDPGNWYQTVGKRKQGRRQGRRPSNK